MNRELRYKYHSKFVERWMEASLTELSGTQLLNRLEAAVMALFKCAQVSISEVTLAAVFDRVLYNSAEQYPLLLSIKVEKDHLNFSGLKGVATNSSGPSHVTDKQLKEAFHYFITEFLFVIGNLTAEQLTPLLHGELNASSVKIENQRPRSPKKVKRKPNEE